MTDTELFEQSFNIAWNVLIQGGELGEPNEAFHRLAATIGTMMKNGERRRLLLSNSAIEAYRQKSTRLDAELTADGTYQA
jgi:hypothetical protein